MKQYILFCLLLLLVSCTATVEKSDAEFDEICVLQENISNIAKHFSQH